MSQLRPTVEAPPAGVDPRVRRVRLMSRALGVRKALYVYLPPGYAASAARYPVLYLLRGHEREWVNPRQDGTRRGTVIDVYLRLLAAGAVGPMILAFPGLSSDDNRVPGLATDFRAPALAPTAPGVGTGRFETYLLREVVPLVDALFRTIPDGRHRGVDGFSLGGFTAVKLAAQHPDLMASAGAYDGTFLYAEARGTCVRSRDRVFAAPFLDPIFGRPRDQAYAAANSPANLILRGPSAPLRRVRWLIQYGPRRLEPMGSNYYRGAYLRRLLASRGIDCPIPPVLADGAHDWATADRHMEMTLPLHWQTLHP